jgi:hypothetical protein
MLRPDFLKIHQFFSIIANQASTLCLEGESRTFFISCKRYGRCERKELLQKFVSKCPPSSQSVPRGGGGVSKRDKIVNFPSKKTTFQTRDLWVVPGNFFDFPILVGFLIGRTVRLYKRLVMAAYKGVQRVGVCVGGGHPTQWGTPVRQCLEEGRSLSNRKLPVRTYRVFPICYSIDDHHSHSHIYICPMSFFLDVPHVRAPYSSQLLPLRSNAPLLPNDSPPPLLQQHADPIQRRRARAARARPWS